MRKVPCNQSAVAVLVLRRLYKSQAGVYNLQSISTLRRKVWPFKTIAVVKQNPGKYVIIDDICGHACTSKLLSGCRDKFGWVKYWQMICNLSKFSPSRILCYTVCLSVESSLIKAHCNFDCNKGSDHTRLDLHYHKFTLSLAINWWGLSMWVLNKRIFGLCKRNLGHESVSVRKSNL